MRKSIVTVLAALTASIAAAPAAATGVTVTVSYADLDLADPAGMAALEERIAAAVDTVCSKVEPRRLRGLIAWEQCKAASLADAMEQLAEVVPARNMALAASSEN